MLTRRHLRIKVMQLIYAYEQGAITDTVSLEKSLRQSIDATFRSYVYNLYLLQEVARYVYQEVDKQQNKFLASDEDRHVSTRIVDNPLILALLDDETFSKKVKHEKISNYEHDDIIKTCFKHLLASDQYSQYINKENPQFNDHKNILDHLYRDIFLADDDVTYHLEEVFPNWQDDSDQVAQFILQCINKFNPDKHKLYFPMQEVYEEALSFGRNLIDQTIHQSAEFDELIKTKLVNWELDRIAYIDIILIKMALTELLHFPFIPVKVTINEYIDISKDYSSPKSKDFINGILDELTKTLREKGSIQKRGRGLVE